MNTSIKKLSICLLFGLLLTARTYGYILVPYESLKKMSDLIVIGVPVQNMDTTNHWSLAGSPHDIPVIGVETRFKILTVLKGELDGKEFVLSHYRWADPMFELGALGPGPKSFDISKSERFLMFLKREGDKIVPVRGVDTAWSIKALQPDGTP